MMGATGRAKYHQDIIIGFATALTALATASYVLRIWARHLSAASWWWDDLVMGIALLGAWSIAIINYVGVSYGLGQHAKDVGEVKVRKYLIDLYSYLLVQTVAVTIIKASILLFYWRLFPTKRFRLAIVWVSAFVAVSFIFAFFGFAFECIPVKTFWGDAEGHCIDGQIFRMFASGSFLLTDLLIYIMPMPIVWHLHTSRRRKIELSLVFLLGGVVCVTGIVRLITLWSIDLKDVTWSNVSAALWNIIEAELGFVAGNVPLMGPLFAKMRHGKSIRSSEDPTSDGKKNSIGSTRHGFRSKGPSNADGFQRMPDDSRGHLFTMAAPVAKADISNVELMGLPTHGIKVKTDLEQNIVEDESPREDWEEQATKTY